MTAPDISVVIPTRDRRALLADTVASVVGQEGVPWELIVVDDRSSDDTWTWLASVRDPRIRAIRAERHGERSAARNLGLREAAADAVLFLDDDDLLMPQGLARLLRSLRSEPGLVAAVGARMHLEVGRTPWRAPHPARDLVRDVLPDVCCDWVAFPSQTLFDRATIADAGAWQAGLSEAEDRELWFRLAVRGRVAFTPAVILAYRVHDGQLRRTATARERRRTGRALRHRAVPDLATADEERARAPLAAGDRYLDGIEHYQDGQHGLAVRSFADAVRLDRRVAVSPLVRPGAVAFAARALLAGVVGGRRWAEDLDPAQPEES